MASAMLRKVLEQVKVLTPDEQRQVREALGNTLSQHEEDEKMKAFHQGLLEAGLIKTISKPVMDIERYRNYKPVEVKGKPVSETIIEERRSLAFVSADVDLNTAATTEGLPVDDPNLHP